VQSKLESLVEAIINTFIGFVIAFISQLLFFPIVGIDVTLGQNFILTVLFTLVSIVRTYIIRRYFNKKSKSKNSGR
jgi:membrane protein implicated in regulation of membrane protease activity